jgi:O-antigen/teichoic acid export membrane protein
LSSPDLSSTPQGVDPNPHASLRQRAIAATGWSVLGLLASQTIRFGSSLISTRLFAPDLFGLVAIAITFIVALTMFSDLGLRQVVIQQDAAAESKTFETIWVLQIARGILIFMFLLLGAGAAHLLRREGVITGSSVYGHPDFVIALLVLSITPVLSGFESLRILYASRELNQKRLTMIELVSQCSALVFTVTWAWWSPDIFAVTLGIVLAGIVRLVLSHTWLAGRSDAFGWSSAQAKRVLHFSKWLLLSSVLGFFAGHGDRLLLAGMLSPIDFGVFTIAALLWGSLFELGSRIVSGVIYPSLCELHRRDPAGLAAGFHKFRLVFDNGIAAVAGLFLVIAPLVVQVLYDNRYLQAGEVMQVLVITLLFQWTSAAMYMFMIIGKTWVMTVQICIQIVAVLIFVPWFASSHGLLGAAWGLVLSRATTLPYVYVRMHKEGWFRWRSELLPLLSVMVGAFCGLAVVWLSSWVR